MRGSNFDPESVRSETRAEFRRVVRQFQELGGWGWSEARAKPRQHFQLAEFRGFLRRLSPAPATHPLPFGRRERRQPAIPDPGGIAESSRGSERSGDPRNAGNEVRILKGCQKPLWLESLASLQDAMVSQSDFRGSATPGYSLRSLRDRTSEFSNFGGPRFTPPRYMDGVSSRTKHARLSESLIDLL